MAAFLNFLLLAVLFAVPAFGAAEWKSVRAGDIEAAGDAGERSLAAAANSVLGLRRAVGERIGRAEPPMPVPLKVLVVTDRLGFPSPVFVSGGEINYLVFSPEDTGKARAAAAYEAFAVYLIECLVGRNDASPWLVHGLASRAAARLAGGQQPAERTGPRIALDVFLDLDHYAAERQTGQVRTRFRGQSDAFVGFLETSFPPERFARFLDALRQERPARYALESAFGVTVAELDRLFAKARPATNPDPIPVPETEPDAVRPLTASKTAAAIADVLTRAGRLDEAEAAIGRIGKSDPEFDVVSGFLAIRQGEPERAAEAFERAAAADPGNYLAHYGLAYALALGRMTEYGFASGFETVRAERMRFHLARAIELAPKFAESYALLAFVNSVRNEKITESLALIGRALAIAPGSQWYRIRQAELLALAGNFEGAARIVARTAVSAADDRLRLYAESTALRIESLRAQLESARREKRIDSDVVTDKPLDEAELARRRERAMLESLNRALRIPGDGENRLIATVTRVECVRSEVLVTVVENGRVRQFRADAFENIVLTSFDTTLVDAEFGCGTLRRPVRAVVTFRERRTGAGSVAEVVAIEFVPDNFRFPETVRPEPKN